MITGYPEQLYSDLLQELANIKELPLSEEKIIEDQFALCIQYKQKLLDWQKENHFGDETEEIYFFKFIQPKFTGLIHFYKKRYQAILFLPPESALQIPFYEYELDKTEKFFLDNAAAYQYFKSMSTDRDREYFLPESAEDLEPSTLPGEIIGHEKYKEFLREKLLQLERSKTS